MPPRQPPAGGPQSVQEGEQIGAADVEPQRRARDPGGGLVGVQDVGGDQRGLQRTTKPPRPTPASEASPASHPVDTGAPHTWASSSAARATGRLLPPALSAHGRQVLCDHAPAR